MTKKKLNLKDLIQEKEKFDRLSKGKKTQELYVEQLDATVTIEEPTPDLVSESIELGQDKNYDGNGDEFLVYNTMVEPNLKDPELHKAYGCVEPTDIVKKIFDAGTVSGIAREAMTLAGYGSDVQPVDKLKN